MDTYVGQFYDAYDGTKEVSIAFVIKHQITKAIATAYKYLDNKCKITMNGKEFIGFPYMGKMARNKYVLSIVFTKQDNEDSDGSLLRAIRALSATHNVEMNIDIIEACGVTRVDTQFWERIKKTLQSMASYSGSLTEWEDYKGYIKAEYCLSMTVGPHMSDEEADHFYDCALDYAKRNDIPIKEDIAVYDAAKHHVNKCREAGVCCVCGKSAYDSTVYPLCQVHYDEYVERGRSAFDMKYMF